MKMVQVHMHTCEHRWTLSCHDNHLEDGVLLKELALLELNRQICSGSSGGLEDLQHGPTFVAESTGAPRSSSSWTRSRWPSLAARCRALSPF